MTAELLEREASPYAGAPDAPFAFDLDCAAELATLTISELRGLAATDLADLAGAEVRRRAAQRARATRRADPVTAEWREMAHAQYLAAEAACAGVLVNNRGIARGIDPWQFWASANRLTFDAYASWELQRFAETSPIISVTGYRRQYADNAVHAADEIDMQAGESMDTEEWAPELAAQPELASYADVVPLEQEHLWEGYVPFGKVTLIAGDSGIGKGFMLSDLAARVSRGDAMPDGTPGNPPGHVIMITPEDDPRTCTVHRLAAHGADLALVHDLTICGGNVWCIQEDMTALRQLITACGGAALVVIDPISAVTLVGLTSDVPVRRKVMGPLEAVARETGAAIVVVGHLTKAGVTAAAKDRAAAKDGMGGSKGLTSAARIMLSVTRDDSDPRIRTLAVVKSNGSDDKSAPAVRYTIAGAPARVQWLTSVSGSGAVRTSSQADACLAVLRACGGVMHGHEVAVRAGIEYDSARMALARLKADGLAESPGRGLFTASGTAATPPVQAAGAPWYAKTRGWEGAPV